MISNHEFYKKAHEKHNTSAKALHWVSTYSQEKRFEVLISFIKEELSNSTLIDVGCGYGHLITYLNNKDIKPKAYVGIDCEDFMIEINKKKYPDYDFFVLDILEDELPKVDYYFCSGAMNILPKKYVFRFIKKCYEASNKGFVFNFITNSFFRTSKKEIIDYCKTFNPNIELKENYLKYDFSIFIKK